jgi:hypothetical protein
VVIVRASAMYSAFTACCSDSLRLAKLPGSAYTNSAYFMAEEGIALYSRGPNDDRGCDLLGSGNVIAPTGRNGIRYRSR